MINLRTILNILKKDHKLKLRPTSDPVQLEKIKNSIGDAIDLLNVSLKEYIRHNIYNSKGDVGNFYFSFMNSFYASGMRSYYETHKNSIDEEFRQDSFGKFMEQIMQSIILPEAFKE